MRSWLSLYACVCALSAAPGRAAAIDWPVPAPESLDDDPLREFRWDQVSEWYPPQRPNVRDALGRLDAAPRETARWHGARAVLLRLSQRESDARAEITRALALAPDRAALDDPDVALTAGWLAARAGDFTAAFEYGRGALPRMPPLTCSRASLVLEIARWSMARGPDGLPGAIDLLRGFVALCPPPPLVRATLALALVRAGKLDEARGVAAPLRVTLEAYAGDGAPRGAVVQGEGPAAVGVALVLVGRGRDAIEPLTRATESVPASWRAFQQSQLALARRSP